MKNVHENGEDIFISKLKFTENRRKSDASENSKTVYDLLQNGLHEKKCFASKSKIDIQ